MNRKLVIASGGGEGREGGGGGGLWPAIPKTVVLPVRVVDSHAVVRFIILVHISMYIQPPRPLRDIGLLRRYD